MRDARITRFVGVAVALGLGLLAPALAGAASPLARCSQARADRSLCGHVTVPLDRSGVDPGVVRLRVRELPAQDGAAAETVLALAGGPGQAATPLLGDIAQALGTTLRSRSLVVFDQRGTGHSGRLTCPELSQAADTTDASDALVAACATRLGAARAHYATADSVADIEAVRVALGVDRLIVYGTSYGTKVALDYAAAYPEHVERLVLDSAVPPEGVDPFLRLTLGSLPRVMRAQCAHGGCPFTPDAAADLATLAQRLTVHPLRGVVIDGRGRPHRATLDATELFDLLLEGDLDPFSRPALPAAVRAADQGDTAPLLRMLLTAGGDGLDSGSDSDALFLATTCEDGGVPWALGTPPAARAAAIDATLATIPAAQLAPFDAAGVRAFGEADLCRAWPESPVAQPRSPLPDVPTLILSGEEDLRTPRAGALQLAARLPQAQVVSVPQVGHSVLGADFSGCAQKALAAFLHGGQPLPCGAGVRVFPNDELAPSRLGVLAPTPGLPLHAGRTLTAVGLTFVDLGRQTLRSVLAILGAGSPPPGGFVWGGLRGGSVRITAHGLVMRDYSYVPGVTVSGRLVVRKGKAVPGGIDLTIGGSAAARGHLHIGEKGIVGRLGGHRVRLSAHTLKTNAALGPVGAARVASANGTARPLPPLPAFLRALLSWG